MPQSHAAVLVHMVFSTKDRAPLLAPEIRPKLHAYVAGIINKLDCVSIQVGGVEDHIHVLFGLSRTRTIADIVSQTKVASGKWLRESAPAFHNFHWQAGYAAFSVNYANKDAVVGYIHRQEEHHKKMTFQEEFRKFLTDYNIEYDERYVWD